MPTAHIVVIDDDQDVREALTMMLEPDGFRVTCCSTGPEGIEVIRRDRPDLVLLDIMLASPSEGFHLAYELRNDESCAHIPIVMISSIGRTMGMDYAKELGSEYMPAEEFLDKPLTIDAVRGAVRRALTGTAERPES